jgi:hypothetical protein
MTAYEQNRAKQAAAGRAKIMLLLLCLVWGINWTVMKIALREIPPLSTLVCTPFDRTGSLVALSTEAKKFSRGEEFQA